MKRSTRHAMRKKLREIVTFEEYEFCHYVESIELVKHPVSLPIHIPTLLNLTLPMGSQTTFLYRDPKEIFSKIS
jgi:hypothetical protein